MHKEMVDHENAGDEKMEVNEMSTEKEAVEACDDHDGIGIDVDKGDKDELIVHEEDNDKFIEQDKKEEKKVCIFITSLCDFNFNLQDNNHQYRFKRSN